ncbi:hypothetical protein [Flammeovirga kamogawensis]|uniref:DUF1819 family protein n=1 Tax=Flammeovirga kamogawensis TaxID=373891 RepID=A0ABX8GWY5_9BACT|nr:hypothetical protein [Flammeovirga kamogawensis]MBB6460559.1 hypothetical protein [Flammeovirga kamogawensis]QWG07919.1 hypothetical protein KM029_03010 [Flammeovirga kamogawensis]TRX69726.1 hypothetical protein EO216_16940 [Flammeovirga kamogawensis]
MDISPLLNLPEKGQSIFNAWQKNAKEHFPSTDIFIDDLKHDILQALEQSLKDIKRKGYEKHRTKKTWVVGVFMEILAKNLNSYWYNVIIISDNKDFTGLLWFKAMLNYLNQDTSAVIEVNRIYKLLLDKHYPFDTISPIESEEKEQNNLLADLSYQSNWDITEPYLNNMLKDRLAVTIDNRGPRLITSEKLFDIFTVDEIYQFIDLNLHIL